MKLFKKIIIATGVLFGLAASLSFFQRKTILLTGRIDYTGNKKNEETPELELEKEYTIRKISGNNEGFILYKNNKEFLKSSERNSLSVAGTRLGKGIYKVLPVNSGKRPADIVIELVE
ncbi:MAG: hypothetical protein ABFS35_20410 [Bacteroidota bacterium]